VLKFKTFMRGINNKDISILTPKGNLIEDINKGIKDKD
ncbi:hypothetical protein Q265_02748, partial [Staphylococcus aureus M1285]